MKGKTRINNEIKASDVRVIGKDGENLGIMPVVDAIKIAQKELLDLIEISPTAIPPVTKVMDYGKYQYEEKKKQKDTKAKAHVIEIKTLQVKIGTGEHDLELKAKNASRWLKEGHRVKLDLFLAGRAKYLKPEFLKERLDRILILITEEYRIVDGPKKSPKGLTVLLEKSK